jgi:hypothetical protein
MDRRTFAIWALLAGLALGLMGNIMFYGRSLGVSFPLFIFALIVVILALTAPAGVKIRWRNLWPLIPVMFFAIMVAVRADTNLNLLNIAAGLALGALALYYLPLSAPLDEASLAEQGRAVLETGMMTLPSALVETVDAWQWLREKRHQRGGTLASITRGLMFTAPVVVVFAALLGSADAVFANYVNDAFESLRRFFGLQYLDDTISRLIVTGGITAVVTGAIGYGLALRRGEAAEKGPGGEDEAQTAHLEKRKPGFKLSMIEGGIIMGSVVALFAAFVVIQFAYFFGGQSTLEVTGLTYAEYARRGFFELVAVSLLTLGLALSLDHATIRQGQRETTLFRALALMLVGLTTVMLVSASRRMWLYEEAYGFTQLRVYVHVCIAWLAVLFGVYVLALFRLRKNVFSFGSALVMVGYLATLNLMNVDAYIAERNIARYHDGQALDVAYFNILSEDAVPVVIPFYQELVAQRGTGVDDKEVQCVKQWLAEQHFSLSSEAENGSLFSFNVARNTALAQLEPISSSLSVSDSYVHCGSYYDTYFSGLSGRYESGWDTIPPTGAPGD